MKNNMGRKNGSRKATSLHSFYCLKCGKNILVPRKTGFQREKMHRKKLYCPYCKKDLNFIECKTFAEIESFRENFAKGLYQEEAMESIAYCESKLF